MFGVGGVIGSQNPSGGFQALDIAVCTIEKTNSLINRLLEEGGVEKLGVCPSGDTPMPKQDVYAGFAVSTISYFGPLQLQGDLNHWFALDVVNMMFSSNDVLIDTKLNAHS